jgi:hydroxybutyrate-dimer hydrolase
MTKLFVAALLASSALSPSFAADSAPTWLRIGPHAAYDGVTDDLVTGGLGAEAMLGAAPWRSMRTANP